MRRSDRIAKRTFDICAAIGGLVVTSPILAVVALAIRLDSPGPVFFRQTRLGAGGTPFRIWKFRTMEASAGVHLSSAGKVVNADDDHRHTRVGRLLRVASIDELPQLLNVLAGDMSLVGPRPDLPQAMEFYSASQTRRLTVKPGITGLAQVRGRNALSPQAKWDIDSEYAASASFTGDLRILASTVWQVLARKHVY